MNQWLVCIFWLSLFAAAYSYFAYPLLLIVQSWRLGDRRAVSGSDAQPSVSLVIAAHNEDGRVREKILNCLSLSYPRLEILFASDCSDDRTDSIVGEYLDRGIRLVRTPERLGKENAQLLAIRESMGEVVVFSDVATHIPPTAITTLAAYFSDPRVGAVSSEDRFMSKDGELAGEGAYVRYEMWLRRMESRCSGLVGLSGSFFATRRVICEPWDIYSPSDFISALNCARSGLLAVTAPDVLGYYHDLKDPQREYARKVRTVLRGLTAIARHPDVLNPFKYGAFSWQVWSHKIMRWVVPFALTTLLLSNFALLGQHDFYKFALIMQGVLYGAVVAAHWWPPLRKFPPLRLAYFFVQVNIAIMHAFWRFCRGVRLTTWKPSAR